jgi:protein-L-isoaspartate(D-aspartate) O-methyltransferase
MVTAAARSVPPELLEQLDVDGVLVMPIERNGQQRLVCVRRTADDFEETDLGAVVFVPLLSGLA